MQINLKNLRSMIREAISETHFGTSTAGSLASTALNRVGPDPDLERFSDVPHDAIEIAKKIRELIGGDAGFPVGDWGDEAFNSAAQAAADALVNQTHQGDRIRTSTRMYEQKENIKLAKQLLSEVESIDPEALAASLNRITKILDSIDMSLDLIYGSFSGYEGPIAGIRGKQRFLGRTLSAPGAAADEN